MDFRVCFVCTGNACRSPFAECVVRKILDGFGIVNVIDVFSVGTQDCGSSPRDATMVAVAKDLGYELSGRTTVMTRERLMTADVIIVFDASHRDAVTRVLDYSNWNRIKTFNREAFDADGNVEDPSFQSEAVYRRVAQHIEEGCKRLVGKWCETLLPIVMDDILRSDIRVQEFIKTGW